jgi:adenylate kinase
MPKITQTPGTALSALLKKYNLNYNRLAKAIGLSSAMVRLIARDENPVSADVAFRLAAFFKMKPEYWLSLQMDYDLAKTAADKKLAKELKDIPTVDKATFERKKKAKKAAPSKAAKSGKPGKRGRPAKAKKTAAAKTAKASPKKTKAKAKAAPKKAAAKKAAPKKTAKAKAPAKAVKTATVKPAAVVKPVSAPVKPPAPPSQPAPASQPVPPPSHSESSVNEPKV